MIAENKAAITHLKCREIQAPIVASIINGFAGELGYAKAIEIAKKVISEDAILSGKTMAKKYSGNSVAELARIVKEVWGQDGAIKIKKIMEGADYCDFRYTKE